MMTQKERANEQKRIMVKHFGTILEPSEAMEYRNKLVKSIYSLVASCVTAPYVAYNLYTLKRNPEVKMTRLLAGLGFQLVFSVLNIRWSRQFNAVD